MQTWFYVNRLDGAVDEDGVQDFLDAIKEAHFMLVVAADGRAATIIAGGYKSELRMNRLNYGWNRPLCELVPFAMWSAPWWLARPRLARQ